MVRCERRTPAGCNVFRSTLEDWRDPHSIPLECATPNDTPLQHSTAAESKETPMKCPNSRGPRNSRSAPTRAHPQHPVSPKRFLHATVSSKPMKQSRKELTNGAACLPMLASVVLAICFLVGPCLHASSVSIEPSRSPERYLVNSSPIAVSVGSPERQVRLQNKAPRRQVSFGVLPSVGVLELPDALGERTITESLRRDLAVFARPNDRAPPQLTS